ncbi:lysophospholipid acyltransferase family protein [Mesoterricola silvestris]|uniref:Acyltransferase n=1 Tax=Mesoterricola silvestris TaxID=2927979 RepID=A0AA48H3Z0_9BACT|nr:lysophospholipid acyltransferase family protein [Mesoterricola silvestris]BDU71463.1 acyltransferase [Mesoterricola silvestris]
MAATPSRLPSRLRQAGKVLTSGILFTLLGVGGCLCSLVIPPVLAVLPGGREARRRRAARIIRLFFRCFVFGLEVSGILRVDVDGRPPGPEGVLILANHPSYLDIVVLIALLPDTVCVVKEAVWNSPIFGSLVRSAGFISNQGPEAVLEHCGQALEAGRNLVIFPEGGRTRAGQPPRFKRGAAHLALRTGAPILPVRIAVDPPLLAKGDRWYMVPAPTCRFGLQFGAPLLADPAPVAEHPRAARALTRLLESRFHEESHGSDAP